MLDVVCGTQVTVSGVFPVSLRKCKECDLLPVVKEIKTSVYKKVVPPLVSLQY